MVRGVAKGLLPLRDLPALPPDAGAGEELPRAGWRWRGTRGEGPDRSAGFAVEEDALL